MSATIAVLVALAALWLSLAPLWRQREEAASEPLSRRDVLAARKASLVTSIKDLDFDHQTGKLSLEDYDSVRAGLLNEAALVARDMEDAGKGDAMDRLLERELAAQLRHGERPTARGTACARCGTRAKLGASFCKKCGERLGAASCPSCRKPLDADADFCADCGAKIETGKAS